MRHDVTLRSRGSAHRRVGSAKVETSSSRGLVAIIIITIILGSSRQPRYYSGFVSFNMAFSPPPGKYEVFYDKVPFCSNLDFPNEGFTYFEEIDEFECKAWSQEMQEYHHRALGYLQDMHPNLVDIGGVTPMYLVKCCNMHPEEYVDDSDDSSAQDPRRFGVALVVGPIDRRFNIWKEFLNGLEEEIGRRFDFGVLDGRKKQGEDFKLVK